MKIKSLKVCVFFALTASMLGCTTTKTVAIYTNYVESISITGLAVSPDKTRLVALGPKYDIVLDAPEMIRPLMSNLHPYMHAEISHAHAPTPDKIYATVILYVENTPSELRGSAIELGFKPDDNRADLYHSSYQLSGDLHRSSGSWPQNFTLNRSYDVEVQFRSKKDDKQKEFTKLGEIGVVFLLPAWWASCIVTLSIPNWCRVG